MTLPGINSAGTKPSPDATRTGAAGAITYAIQVSTDEGFTGVIASWTAPEGTAQTVTGIPTTLGYDTRYYWRVRAKNSAGSSAPFRWLQGWHAVTRLPGS